MEKISVIVPVYNVEKYLRQCIESLIAQTYSNLEIILVDDGSTDGSSQICDEYAKRYENIQVIHKENGGLSDARNVGIAISTGEYIGFVDSEDWVDRDMYEILYNLLKKNATEIAEVGVKYEYPDCVREVYSRKTGVFGKRIALAGFLDQSIEIRAQVMPKLYRAEIVKQVMFEKGRLHEDGFFTYKAMYLCERYVISDVCKYNYRQQREGSIMNQAAVTPKSYYDIIDAFEERNQYFEEKGEMLLCEKSRAYYYKTLVSFMRALLKYPQMEKELLYVKKRINAQHQAIIRNPYLGWWKVKYIAYRILCYSKFKERQNK